MIGYSLSFCVADCLHGKVNPKDVQGIVAGTCARNKEDWDRVIARYRKVYWRSDPDRGEQIARQWIETRIVTQPRINGEEPPNIAAGHWKD